jgi:ribonuclease Y
MHMTNTALYAAAGIAALVIASAVFLYLGLRFGARREVERQRRSKSTAEETARRITSDAEREAESLRKTALLSGKEELIKLRENWETEARGRREEIEKEER